MPCHSISVHKRCGQSWKRFTLTEKESFYYCQNICFDEEVKSTLAGCVTASCLNQGAARREKKRRDFSCLTGTLCQESNSLPKLCSSATFDVSADHFDSPRWD